MRSLVGILAAAVIVSVTGCTRPELSAPPAPPPAAVTGTWQELAPAPSQRTEVAAAAFGRRIAVVGGYRGDGTTVGSTEIFDTVTGRWQRGPELPVAVNHAMAASASGVVHVFGGYRGDRSLSRDAFTLVGDAWRPIAPLPQPRAAGAAVAVEGRIFLVAGVGPGGLAAETLVYDVATDRWSTAPGPPTPREHLGGAAAGGLVYTVGGRRGGLDTNLSTVEWLDPRTGEWTRGPDLPTARGGLAATATCAGHVVAVGGEAESTFAEAELYEPATGAWRSLPRLPHPRHGLGVVAIDNTVYTLAGGPHPGLHVADVTESLDLGGDCSSGRSATP